mmetsp:Transcript_722/g.2311  ORF Transcript_722/g.2311 Transcript_722/m.2311 type:complete len:278 (+) Transcript_722:792-1625(+)
MLLQVVVASGGHTKELLLSKGELESDVGAGASIVGKFVLGMDFRSHKVLAEANGLEPSLHVLEPLLVSRRPDLIPGLDEVLDLHLLEFTAPEDEIPRGDLIAEGLANLGNAKGNLGAGNFPDVLEVDKDALRSFRAEIGRGGRALEGTDLSGEHEVEVTWRRQVSGVSRGRRRDQLEFVLRCLRDFLDLEGFQVALLGGFLLHFLGSLEEHISGFLVWLLHAQVPEDLSILELHLGVEELVCTVPELGDLAVDHRIREASHMPRGLPNRRRTNDRRV